MDMDWQVDLERWLAPFVAALGHKTRARMCPLYVAGLIGPGDRKSVQPMAARAGEVGVAVTLVLWDQELAVERLQRRIGLRLPIVEVLSNDLRLNKLADWSPEPLET